LRKRTLDFDGVIKLLIQGSGGEPFRQLRLGQVKKWLNVDLPTTQHRCVDLLCLTTDGKLVHIELQATNESSMPYRMAEYALTIRRTFGKYPKQVVLYVGNKPLRMKAGFRTEGMRFRYRLVDVRDLDGAALLASASIADNILAMLAMLDDSAEGIRRVARRIDKLNEPSRQEATERFLITCGLRGLDRLASEELEDMPITKRFDYRKSPFFVKRFEEVRQVGLQEGRQEGRQGGLHEGRQEMVLLALKRRFGRIPASITKRVAAMSDDQAQELFLQIVDGKDLKDLFDEAHR
jgi:predicted transposase YdaD